MLEEIIDDTVAQVRASNQPMFDKQTDFEALERKRVEGLKRWNSLSIDERNKFASQKDFEIENNIPDLKDSSLSAAKNLSILRKEVVQRINSSDIFQLLPIDVLEFEPSLMELAESIENIEYIREMYRARRLTTGSTKNAGISSEEASKIKNFFAQGRELYVSGREGSLMVKPLNLFYSLTAYTYGIIILNNPLRYRKDMLPGSHGMSYLPETIQAQFGGDSPRGTFSDLVTSFPTHVVKNKGVDFQIDCTESVLELYENRFNVSLGLLLSMVPEMSDYYKLTTGRSSRCYPLEISNANDPRSLIWEFHIGDGESRPSLDSVESSFSGFAKSDRHGKIVVTVPAARVSSARACIYTDIRGNLWFIDNPFLPIILPEVSLHFLISSIFSNIMRYRPDEWGNILTNNVKSNIYLLTRHYFSSLQSKFLVLILRCTTKYIPFASERVR